MSKPFAKLAGGLLLVLAAVAIVFVAGMRANSPPVLNAVRRTSRTMRPLALKSAGERGAYASVVRHVGRTSGRPYETPVRAEATDEGFLIALPYGPNTDWLKNVLATGSATIVDEGRSYQVDQPEIVPTPVAAPFLPPEQLRTLRMFAVDQCLRVRRVDPDQIAEPANRP